MSLSSRCQCHRYNSIFQILQVRSFRNRRYASYTEYVKKYLRIFFLSSFIIYGSSRVKEFNERQLYITFHDSKRVKEQRFCVIKTRRGIIKLWMLYWSALLLLFPECCYFVLHLVCFYIMNEPLLFVTRVYYENWKQVFYKAISNISLKIYCHYKAKF